MLEERTYITQEGLDKLKEELHLIKTQKRKEVALRIKEAQELGDLSENAEYAEAKDEQAKIDGRILELEELIPNVTLIQKSKSTGTVNIGSTLLVRDEKGKEYSYTIVGPNEVDPLKGKISNESPMGKAFLNKKIGDTVEVQVPKGVIPFEILKIS